MGVAAGRAAVAEPAERDARLVAHAEGERAADCDGQHRGQVRDHRQRAEADVAEVHVAVAAARRAVAAAEVLGDDPPRRHAAHDVHAEVALGRAADVLGRHRPGHADGGGLVAAAGVERAGDPALPVQGVAALLDGAGQQHRAIHPAQHRFVESVDADRVVTARALAHDCHDPHRSSVMRRYAMTRSGAVRARARALGRMLRACWHARTSSGNRAAFCAGCGWGRRFLAGVPGRAARELPRLRPARDRRVPELRRGHHVAHADHVLRAAARRCATPSSSAGRSAASPSATPASPRSPRAAGEAAEARSRPPSRQRRRRPACAGEAAAAFASE